MTKLGMRLPVLALLVAVAGCASSDSKTAPLASVPVTSTPSRPETAVAGDAFCVLAEAAHAAGNDVDSAAEPAVLKPKVVAAVEAYRVAAVAAPADYRSIADKTVALQEQVVKLLEKYDFDFTAAVASDEGKAFFDASGEYEAVRAQRDDYLTTHCGIDPTDDSTPSGGLNLAPGEEGIRQFFKILQLNDSLEITDEQVECMVTTLSGAISDADLQAIADRGEVTPEGTSVFNDAFATCKISLLPPS